MFGCTCNEVLLEQLREIADCHERTLHFQRFLERVDGDVSFFLGGGGLNAKKLQKRLR